MENLHDIFLRNGLMISYAPEKGRCLIANRDFMPGEVIISQESYASIPTSAGSRCDGCFAPYNLKKCSMCRMASYCGISCQKAEWKMHQHECKDLMELREDRRKLLTPSMRLMVRLLLKRKLQHEKVLPTTTTDNYVLVEALMSHMSDIGDQKLVLYAQMANLVKLAFPSLEQNIKKIAEYFSMLACNAHTICDNELRSIGTGLYPVISIINHSCLPNSVLMFDGKVAVVRAVDTILKDTEVTISYIENAAPTDSRQESLKKQYFFACKCPRCVRAGLVDDVEKTAIMDGYRCKDNDCNGFLLLESDAGLYICQKCRLARNQHEVQRMIMEVGLLLDKAALSLSSGNYYESNLMYKAAEQLQMEVCHYFSIKLLHTREALVKCSMELNDWNEALLYCRKINPVYERLYPPVHPLVGLQFYTCGKLEWLLGDTLGALKSFTKAVDILRITHGNSGSLVKEAAGKLEEARAEAAYCHAACENK